MSSIWPISQNPECTYSISHNAPFRTEKSTFLFWMEHCGIWNRYILGFVKLFYWISSLILTHTSLEMLALTLFKNIFPWKFILGWISNWKLWQLRIIFLAGLEHDEERALMFCKYCKEHDRSVSSFVSSGCGSMRLESLQSHWSSSSHLLSRQAYMRCQRPQQDGPMDLQLRQLEQHNTEVLIQLFNTIYYILKGEQPFTNITGLLALLKKMAQSFHVLFHTVVIMQRVEYLFK